MPFFPTFFLILLVVCAEPVSNIVGVQATVEQKSINEIKNYALSIAKSIIMKTTIPPMTGSTKVLDMTVDYTISNFQFMSLNLPNAVLKIEDNAIAVTVTGGDVSLNLDWSWEHHHFPHASDHGTATATLTQLQFQWIFTINHASGKLVINCVANPSIPINAHSSIAIHGGNHATSWLYKLFQGKISQIVQQQIQDAIFKTGPETINSEITSFISKIPTLYPITKSLDLDTFVLETNVSPSIGGISIGGSGATYDSSKPLHIPYVPKSKIPAPDKTSQNLYLQISDYVPNGMFFAAQQAGYFERIITNANRPHGFPEMHTSLFRFIIPQLYSKYGNTSFQLKLSVVSTPQLLISDSGYDLSVPLSLAVEPIVGKTIDTAFTLEAKEAVNVKLSIVNVKGVQSLSTNFTFVSSDIIVLSSNVGNIDVGLINDFFNFFHPFIIEMMNKEIQPIRIPGLPEGIKLINPILQSHTDYFSISTDISLP